MDVIYLDHNATTPLVDEVSEAMNAWVGSRGGNPSSQHQLGRRARQVLEDARDAIAAMLGAPTAGPRGAKLIFTSGGTEANNLALASLARLGAPGAMPGEAVISAIEHPSVSAFGDWLSGQGWKVHRLRVDRRGVVDLDHLDELLCARPQFISVMLANNETGAVQPVQEIAKRCGALNIPLHTDAAQMVGKLPVDFGSLGASALSVAAHKFHGPVGIGALVVRHDVEPQPMLRGGFQQQGFRPGTESVALVLGMHAALAAWNRDQHDRQERLTTLRDRLESALMTRYPDSVVVNSHGAARVPHTTNIAFTGLDRQALLMALDLAGVACSTGSACASGSSEPSAVLVAMGCSKDVVDSSLRFSLGATTTADEVEEAIRRILAVCERMFAQQGKHFASRLSG